MAHKDPEKRRAYDAAYHAAHPEKRRASSAAYRAAHPEEVRAYNAAYRAAHPEEVRAYDAAYHAAHPEEGRAYSAAYRAAHREEQRAYSAARRGRYPTEAKVEKYLVDCVELMGGMCPKFNDPGKRGAPDRIVCLPGHPSYYIELKRPKLGKLDAHQARYHDALRSAGQRVWVLWSKEEVDGFFAEI
jgi:hypothetical protein